MNRNEYLNTNEDFSYIINIQVRIYPLLMLVYKWKHLTENTVLFVELLDVILRFYSKLWSEFQLTFLH
jgi:hypothetical protein